MLASKPLISYSAQNGVLRIIIGSYKISSIDHLHSETEMIQVKDHLEPSFCATSGTMSACRERLSPHHKDGSSTKGDKRETLHQTLSNRVITASKQQERRTSCTSHLICQYSNIQYEG